MHMSACIAQKLAKLRWFKDIDRNHSFKRQMIAAAVAAGTTAAFGTPTAGVIFSIEVATTYYMISNLMKAFFAATFCLLAFRYFEVL